MSAGLGDRLSLRRSARMAVGPVVTIAVAFVTALPGTFSPAPPIRTVAEATPLGPSAGLTPSYLRSLPHDEVATLGAPRFATQPPVSVGTLLASGGAVPTVALAAYGHAVIVLAATDPGCHLAWYQLAAIGRVESDNGQTNGPITRVSTNGTITPPIYGPVLDGAGGLPAYPTPDHGRLEGGGAYERAVGPMQFLPSTWLEYGRSANGDGPPDPQNYYDAALTAGVYLCANGGDLATPAGFSRAVEAYNHSASYLSLVLAWSRFYERVGIGVLLGAGGGLLRPGVASLIDTGAAGAALAQAVDGAEAGGAVSYSFDLVAGSNGSLPIAQGTALVGLANRRVVARVSLGPTGTVLLDEQPEAGAEATELALPAGLAAGLGVEPGSFVAVDSALLAALPPAVRAVTELLSAALPVLLDSCSGGVPTSVVAAGSGTIGSVDASAYRLVSGVGTALSGSGEALGALGRAAGGSPLAETALVTAEGVLGELVVALPDLGGAFGAARLVVRIEPVSNGPGPLPSAGPFPPGAETGTTTTTSTSTSTSTTTTTAAPTTSTTSTSSTTTTTSTSTTTTTLAGG